jgi:hypothetical protein
VARRDESLPVEDAGHAPTAPAAGGALDPADLARDWFPLVVFLAPLLLALATYWPRLDDYFALDDFVWLLAVQDRSLPEVIARGFTFPEFTAFDAPTPFFRPLADAVFKMEELAFGLEAGPYHAVNLLLHVAVAGMGGLLTARLTRSDMAGMAVAVTFAVYPTYDVAVSWISQLSELLGAACALAALLAYHAWLTSRRSGRHWLLAVAVLAAALAALSKESQITVFVLLPLLAWATGGGMRSGRAVGLSLAPVAVLAVAHGAFLIANEFLDASADGTHDIGWHMFRNGWRYVQDIAFPFDPGRSWSAEIRPLLAVVYLAIGAAAIAGGWRTVALFVAWSLVALAPFVIGLGPAQPRYTYLAALPFIACIAAAAVESARVLPRATLPGIAALGAGLVTLFVIAGVQETRDQQRFIASQAENADRMIAAVRARCGDLPPESRISIENAGVLDPFAVIVPAAVNVYYDRVYAAEARFTPAGAEPPITCEVDVLRDAPR